MGDNLQRKQFFARRFFLKDEVIPEVADTEEGLSFRVLVYQEVDSSVSEIPEVIREDVVTDQADVLFPVFFETSSDHRCAFGRADKDALQFVVHEQFVNALLETGLVGAETVFLYFKVIGVAVSEIRAKTALFFKEVEGVVEVFIEVKHGEKAI